MRKFLSDILVKASLGVEQNAYVLGTVGIGTTTPQRKLHVAGNFAVNASGSQYYGVYIPSNGEGANPTILIGDWWNASGNLTWNSSSRVFNINSLYGSSAAPITFSGNGAERMRIDSAGNVGIGTTSPGSKLEVVGTGQVAGFISSNTNLYTTYRANGSDVGYIGNGVGTISGGSAGDFGFQSIANTVFSTGGSGVERMRITSAGNVGIGTTSPSVKFQVESSGVAAFIKSTGNSVPISIFNSANTVSTIGFKGSTTTNEYNVRLGADAENLVLYTNNTERVRVTSAGNVGIGTTSPGYKLSVAASGNSYNVSPHSAGVDLYSTGNIAPHYQTNYWWFTGVPGAGTFRMGLDASGNLGIGTSTPGYKLDVFGSARVSDTLFINTTANRGKLNIAGYDNGGINIIDQRTASSGIFYSSITFRDYYDSVVAASIDFYHNQYFGSGVNRLGFSFEGSERLTILRSGNVGIGTSSPSEKLEVVGIISSARTTYGPPSDAGGFRLKIQDYGGIHNDAGIGIGASSGLMWFNNVAGGGFYWNDGTNGERMRLTAAGNLGIGTTSPGAKLEVYGGNLSLKLPTYAGSARYGFGNPARIDDAAYIEYNGVGDFTGSLIFATNGSTSNVAATEKMRITSGGNVGIGTTSPTTKLEVIGGTSNVNGYADGTIQVTSLSPIAFVATSNLNPSLNRWGFKLREVNEGDFSIYDYRNSANRLLINSSGNVGIGTTSPLEKLHVSGVGRFDNVIQSFGNWSTSYPILQLLDTKSGGKIWNIENGRNSNNLEFYSSGGLGTVFSIQHSTGNVGIGTTSPTQLLDVVSSSNNAIINLDGASNTTTGFILRGSGTERGRITFANSNDLTFSLGSAVSERMRITSTGNVGIGVASPGVRLDVSGDIRASNVLYGSSAFVNMIRMNGGTELTFRNSSNVEVMRITSAGLVGIGTTTPAAKLNISGNLGSTIGGGNSAIKMTNTDTGNFASISAGIVGITNSGMEFSIDGSRAMVISGSGNVGIGTTSPGAKLHVIGSRILVEDTNAGIMFRTGGVDRYSVASTGGAFQIYDEVNLTNRLYITSGGNVGIGTTSPSAPLHVYKSVGAGDYVAYIQNTGAGNGLKIYNADWDITDYLLYATNGGTAANGYAFVVDGNGKVGVGTSSPSYKLHVEGNVSGISIYASHDIAAFSDITVKKEIKKIENAIEKVKELNGYTYVRTDDEAGTRRAGVIAQEVQKVLPEVVSANPDGTLNVAYSNMIALLIEGMKEQQATIERLEDRIKQLEK